jgi:hypothetical protein
VEAIHDVFKLNAHGKAVPVAFITCSNVQVLDQR